MRTYFPALFMSLFLLVPIVLAQQTAVPIPPADFKIIAISGGVSPWDTESKVEIDAQGHGVYYTMSSRDKGDFKKVNEFTIERLSLKAIYAAVAKSDFFNLKDQYINEGVSGGSFAEVTVSLHGKTHTVRTQNIEVPLFDDINIAVNLATPKDNKIQYNAIL
jgi:hypothetical protein